MEMDTHFSHHPTLSQPHAELIKRSLTGSDISKYNKSWPHVTSSISEWKKSSGRSNLFACYQRDARRSNCSSSLCFHSHATVPHIVALPDFSFHVAKIESIFVNSKFLSSECNKCLHLYCWVVKKFARRVKFLRGNLSKSHFFLVLFDKITFFYYLCRQLPAIVVVRPLVACPRKGLKKTTHAAKHQSLRAESRYDFWG